MRRQMKTATKEGARLFRNNVGKAWVGKSQEIKKEMTVQLKPGDVVVRNARRFHAGLHAGSGDLIGWNPVKITEEHLGRTLALFTSAENKVGKGQPTEEQMKWARAVLKAGGLAGISRSDDDLRLILLGQGHLTL